jgi:stress response protein YsnF
MVRVRSYIVERPVEAQVRLHEERVEVARHPVDRPVNLGDASLFKERVIEAQATSEEAVIGKEARVVEEVALRKEATDRTETVHDTVRKTEVEVERDPSATEDARGTRTANTAVSTAGTTSSETNAPGERK